jgi:hypothetical protein
MTDRERKKRGAIPGYVPMEIKCDDPDVLLDLIDLQSFHCRWPFGEGNLATRYCGKLKWRGSYCFEHAKIGYNIKDLAEKAI